MAGILDRAARAAMAALLGPGGVLARFVGRRDSGRTLRADVSTLDIGALAREIGARAIHASPPCQRYSSATREDARAALPDEDAPALPPSARARCKCGCGLAVYSSSPTGRPPLYASVACRKRAFRALKGSFDARCR